MSALQFPRARWRFPSPMTIPNLIFGRAGEGVHVDLDRLYESRLLIQGVSGSGKSTLIRSLLEQTHGKVPQLVFDFEGDFVTLREKFDYILVGKGGDVPLAIKTAKVTLRRLVELNVSAIFDLSEMKFGERREYVRICCEELVHLPRGLQHTRLIVLDEGQVFAPEKGQGESVATLAVIDLVTLGRKRGLVPIVATQRLSKLHKDVAGNLQNKLIGFTDDVDLKRSGDALGMTKEQSAELKRLETHTFYAYGPAISRNPVLVRTLMPATKPPPRGQERPPAPPARAAIQKVLAQLIDLPKEAEEEARTVADLQRKNADLERRIRQVEKTGKPVEVKVADQAAIDRAVKASQRELAVTITTLKKALEVAMKFIINISTQNFDVAGVDKAELERAVGAAVAKATGIVEQRLESRARQIEQLRTSAGKIVSSLKKILQDEKAVEISVGVTRNPPFTVQSAPAPRPAPVREPRPQRVASGSGDSSLAKGEKAVLTAIAQYQDGALRDQLTVLTGYKRSSRDTYIQRLSQAGFVEIQGNSVRATDAGIDALGSDYEPLPQGEQLQEYWLARLPEGERKILEPLIAAYPETVSREQLDELTGYKRSSRDTYIQRLSSRRLVETVGRGEVRASPTLFSEALV